MNTQNYGDYNKQTIEKQTLARLNKDFHIAKSNFKDKRASLYGYILTLHKNGYNNKLITEYYNEVRIENGEEPVSEQYLGKLLKILKRKAGDKS